MYNVTIVINVCYIKTQYVYVHPITINAIKQSAYCLKHMNILAVSTRPLAGRNYRAQILSRACQDFY